MISECILFLFFNDTATTEIYTYGHTLSLHDALPVSLGSPSRPRYLLAYKITESISAGFTTRSEEVTRNNLVVAVSYTRHDYERVRTFYCVSISSYSSYNLAVADYSNLISEKNARERALQDSAEQLRLRLGNYFGKYRKKDAAGEAAGTGR